MVCLDTSVLGALFFREPAARHHRIGLFALG